MPRLRPYQRKAIILRAALNLAAEGSYLTITVDAVAEKARVSAGLVNSHFKNVSNLRDEVVRAAVVARRLSVIAQGLVNKHPYALQAPVRLKKLAIASLGVFND
jgi:AcrR family transcriptional regulator